MGSRVTPASLDEIRADALPDLYPTRLLHGCETALILFAAGFYGRQDGIFIADAGLTATCVDLDGGLLNGMRVVYPAGWEFVEADVYEFSRRPTTAGRRWDIVSIDCPSNEFDRCAGLVHVWCSFATKAVVLGTASDTEVRPPARWRVRAKRRRSDFAGGTYWTILEPRR